MVGIGREAWWDTRGPGSQTATRHRTEAFPSLREIQESVLKLPHREGFTCILYKWWRVE